MAKTQQRPVTRVRRRAWEWAVDSLSVVVLVLSFGLLAARWSTLPDQVPTHFGISGRPDAYGSKYALIAVPIFSVALWLLLSLVARAPHVFNYPVAITQENAAREYGVTHRLLTVLKLELVATFGALEWQQLEVASGNMSELSVWFLPSALLGVLLTLAIGVWAMVRAR